VSYFAWNTSADQKKENKNKTKNECGLRTSVAEVNRLTEKEKKEKRKTNERMLCITFEDGRQRAYVATAALAQVTHPTLPVEGVS